MHAVRESAAQGGEGAAGSEEVGTRLAAHPDAAVGTRIQSSVPRLQVARRRLLGTTALPLAAHSARDRQRPATASNAVGDDMVRSPETEA